MILEADISDTLRIRELIHKTVRACYPSIYHRKVIEFFISYHSDKQIRKRISEGTVVCLEDDGQLLGTGFLCGNELGGVYIDPGNQRKGYGRTLVNYLLEKARENRLDHIWLDATPLAKPLYDQLGFTVVSPMRDMIGDIPLDYFKMELKLT